MSWVEKASAAGRILLRQARPDPEAVLGAGRAGLTLAAPLFVLAGTDRLDLAVYATFGAFTGVYGGTTRTRHRWRLQAGVGVLFTIAVVAGTVVATQSSRGWWVIPLGALVAAAGARLSDRYAWIPPGPMFLLFAFVTSAAIPAAWHTVGLAAITCATTAVWGLCLAVLEVALFGAHPPRAARASPRHGIRGRRLHALRCATAVALAGATSTAVGIEHPYWAMVAAVVPLAAHELRSQVSRGVHRVVGTFVGLGLAGLLLSVSLSAVGLVATLAVLQAATELWVVRIYGLALVFITPMALLVVQRSQPEPVATLLGSRLTETVIGVSIGLVLALVTRERVPGTTKDDPP